MSPMYPVWLMTRLYKLHLLLILLSAGVFIKYRSNVLSPKEEVEEYRVLAEKHNVSANEYNVSAKKYNVSANEYNVTAKKYNVSAKKYNVSAKKYNVSAKEFKVSAKQYRMLKACLGYTADDAIFQKILSTIPSGPDGSPPSNDSHQQIKSYSEEEEQRCSITEILNRFNSTTTGRLCPCIPPTLEGRLTVKLSASSSLENISKIHSDVEVGGEWKPPGCVARTRVAIVIPYRDRKEHLRTFLLHMLPILKRQLVHFRIFLAEQNLPAIFNKASMMNIGFLEARKLFDFDCVIFHDIDILMEDDRNLVNCNGFQPHHFAISLDRWNYKLKYEDIFGAVVSMRSTFFESVNGFSNSYFGWGGEDDDFGIRVRRQCSVFRPPDVVARYTTVKHNRDTAFKLNRHAGKLVEKLKNSKVPDGLSTISYNLIRTQDRPLYTIFLVNLNATRLPYPTYMKYSYKVQSGFCQTHKNINSPAKDLVQITCQLECDMLLSCLGYSFNPEMENSCVIHGHKCHLENNTISNWKTYFKGSRPRWKKT